MNMSLASGLSCAPHLAFAQVGNNNMAPDFSRHDMVVYRHDTPRYLADGFYVLEQIGVLSVWRVQVTGKNRLRVSQNLDWAEAWSLSGPEFNRLCRGMVVGVVKVLDPEMIRPPVQRLSFMPVQLVGAVQ